VTQLILDTYLLSHSSIIKQNPMSNLDPKRKENFETTLFASQIVQCSVSQPDVLLNLKTPYM